MRFHLLAVVGSVLFAFPALAMSVDLAAPLREGRDRALDAYERAYLQAALERTGGNVTRAAELAGVNRKFIQRAMKRLGLRDDDGGG